MVNFARQNGEKRNLTMPSNNQQEVAKATARDIRRAFSWGSTIAHWSSLATSASKTGWTSIHTAKFTLNAILQGLHELFEYFDMAVAAEVTAIINVAFNILFIAHELLQDKLGQSTENYVASSSAVAAHSPAELIYQQPPGDINLPPSSITFNYDY